MPSPFPGMDPYLEDPRTWPDFHASLASALRGALNRRLPSPYYARVELRTEVGIADEADGPGKTIVPDVLVLQGRASPSSAIATTDPAQGRTTASPWVEFPRPETEAVRHYYLEIRDPAQGHKLITLMEIVSPWNKKAGAGRQAYRKKQREILKSDASLVEIDLVRRGRRPLPDAYLEEAVRVLSPRPDYLVLVSRSWRRRGDDPGSIAFPIRVREPLPCIVVPLKESEPEMLLDLQSVFDMVYDAGPYHRGAVDYSRPPVPPLSDEDAEWASGLLAAGR